MQTTDPPVHFLNLEYFFRLLYAGLHGGVSLTGGAGLSGLLAWMTHVWLVFTVLAYLFSLAAIGYFVYCTMRLYQVRKDEEERYKTIGEHEAHDKVEHSRWAYITQLIESGQESDWRSAIIESDIMLDELLTRLGYQGQSVGEKLKAVNPNQFQTIRNAWDAHMVRNDIAHQGSQYQLSEHIAHRTIANYEAVFREHHEI
ncbi:MAG: protein of unknown function with transrane region [Parcubacteria group bacterium]|nr:protein of unknown function with transrane region [Parcubacteria group bacterium]